MRATLQLSGSTLRIDSSDMTELIADMEEVVARLGPPEGTGGRAIQFVGRRSGDGVSTLSRAFAQAVSAKSKRGVWLVELDVLADVQAKAIASRPDLFGTLGPAVRASPDGSSFFAVRPSQSDGKMPDASYLKAHSVGSRRFWVTRFQHGLLGPGQVVEISNAKNYWQSLREHADWIIVDAPALERSHSGLIVAPQMDGNILVIDAERGDLDGDRGLRDQILQAGGRIAGAVLNRATSPANLTRSAGRSRRS